VRAITFPHLDVRAAKEYGTLERGFGPFPPSSRSKARLVPIKAKNGYTFYKNRGNFSR